MGVHKLNTVIMGKRKLITKDQATLNLDRYSRLSKCFKHSNDPEIVKKDLEKLIISAKNLEENKKKEIIKEIYELVDKHSTLFNLDNHFALANALPEKYQAFSIELTRRMENEYGCKSASEVALIQIAVSAYIRTLVWTERFEACWSDRNLSNVKTNYYKLITKELDRSHRQYISALTLLRQIKSPTVNVKVKVESAFIAQNQLINKLNKKEDKK